MAERSVFPQLHEEDSEGGFFDRIVDQEVIRAIEELPEDFRVPLVLADLEGIGYQEISELLEIPVGTVKSRSGLAFSRMRKLMESEAG